MGIDKIPEDMATSLWGKFLIWNQEMGVLEHD